MYQPSSLLLPIGLALLLSMPTYSREPLPGTSKLEWDGDLASRMVDGIDRFLLRKLSAAERARDTLPPTRELSDEQRSAKRARLARMLGVRDSRISPPRMEFITFTDLSSSVGKGKAKTSSHAFEVHRVRWQVTEDYAWEGLLVEPQGSCEANVIAIPDASQSPEWLVGTSYARQLAAANCRVLVPTVISRSVQKRRNAELTDREFLHRSAFELGRSVTGYELQAILSLLEWCDHHEDDVPVGVLGWGEGGRLAIYTAALRPHVDAVCVSGYFGRREGVWEEPLDRNVFGLLNEFGDAELAAMTSARVLIDRTPGPQERVQTRGGAPYLLATQSPDAVVNEVSRAKKWGVPIQLVADDTGRSAVSPAALRAFAEVLRVEPGEADPMELVEPNGRQRRLVRQLDHHNQRLLELSAGVRREFFKQLDVSSVEKHQQSVGWYREYFRRHVVGEFDDTPLPPKARTRKVMDQPTWTGYEVVLDVYPDVFAFGILLLPKTLVEGERRPVVVCQHGLEGRPRDVIEGDHRAYHDYAAKLAERGFITFAPQNIYIFQDRFRTLQRKANPMGKTLFSIMVPQHRQIVDWLATLPYVDPDRIAFYGLSYGGKSAMRIPPLVDRYCLSICSADFNDWVWKNASTLSRYSYVWSGEYEIFEWDLGSTFNYAEMAALIAPRPFMVERGHFDGVAPDERVAYEFAKVRHLYQANLGIGDRCEIEWFHGKYKGVHTINGQGTFDFLHRHLNWPIPKPTEDAAAR